MNPKDPMDALRNFYSSQAPLNDEQMLRRILEDKSLRRQRLFVGLGGFAFAGVMALSVLAWAARPSHTSGDATANAITRYQMINAGLVERNAKSGVVSQ